MTWLIALLCVSLFVLCDALAADWAKNDRSASFWIATVIVLIAYGLFAFLNKYWTLSQVGMFVNVGIALGALMVSYFYFKEELAAHQWLGIALGVVAMILVGIGNGK